MSTNSPTLAPDISQATDAGPGVADESSALHNEAMQPDTLGLLLIDADRAQDAVIGGEPESLAGYAKSKPSPIEEGENGQQFIVFTNAFNTSTNQYSDTAIAAANQKAGIDYNKV